MVFKKKKKLPQVADQQELQVIFGRLIDDARALELKFGQTSVRARLIDEDDTSVFVEFSATERERHQVRTNISLNVFFYYEGKEYQGLMKVLGAGKFEGREALRLAFPPGLNINDEFGLTQLHLPKGPELAWTSMFNDFCEGRLVNIGTAGLDFVSTMQGKVGEYIIVDKETTVGVTLSGGPTINAQGRVLYINQVGQELIGVKFNNLDSKLEHELEQWIAEREKHKKSEDANFLKNRKAGGSVKRETNTDMDREGPLLMYDYKPVLHEGDPKILVLARNEDLLARIGKILSRKYGVLISKGRYTNVQKIIDFYHPCLILINEHLDTVSGFDLARTIASENDRSIPLAMMGSAEDAEAKLQQARGFKAVNYLVVEPFQPLALFKKVEDLMQVVLMKMKVTERARKKREEEQRREQEEPETPELPSELENQTKPDDSP